MHGKMVAQNMLHAYDVKQVFSETFFGFDESFDVTKCLQQIETPDLLHMCAKANEQPSNTKTMQDGGEKLRRFKFFKEKRNMY